MKIANHPLDLNGTLKEMFETGKYEKLYVVRVFIENDRAGTDVWFVYDDIYYVKRYLGLLKKHYASQKDYEDLGDNRYRYRDKTGNLITEHIVISKYERAA